MPLRVFVPVQAPDATQSVAFVELQRRVDAPPVATDVGSAESETLGAGDGVGAGDGDGVGLGVGLAPDPAGVDTSPSQPASTAPRPIMSVASETTRKWNKTIRSTRYLDLKAIRAALAKMHLGLSRR